MVVKSGDGEGPPDALPDEHRGTSILPSPIGVALKPWQSSSAQIQKKWKMFHRLESQLGSLDRYGGFRVAVQGCSFRAEVRFSDEIEKVWLLGFISRVRHSGPRQSGSMLPCIMAGSANNPRSHSRQPLKHPNPKQHESLAPGQIELRSSEAPSHQTRVLQNI